MPTVADRNNNPGNLRDTKTGSFRQFNNPQEGYAALLNDLQAKQTGTTSTGVGPSSTLADFAKVYAPPGDNNNSAQYTANLANHMKVRPDAKLSELDLGKWADAIAHAEGYSKAAKPVTTGYNPTPFSSGDIELKAPNVIEKAKERIKEPEQSFLQEAGGNIKDAFKGLATARDRRDAGELNTPVAMLSGFGSLFGGIGALANTALTHAPIVGKYIKGAENAVGDFVGSAVNTEGGQALVGQAQEFQKAHPNISATLGAAGNILSGVGALEGGGAIKNLVTKGAVRAGEAVAPVVAQATKNVPGLVGRTAQGVVDKKALSEAEQILKTPITKKAIATARAENRITPEGQILPSAKQVASKKEVANLVKEGTASSKLDAAANSGRIGQAADLEAEGLESAVGSSIHAKPVPYDKIGAVYREAAKEAIASLASGEKPLQTLFQVFVDALPKTDTLMPVDILKARKALGKYVRANKGKWKEDGVFTSFMSVRNAIWNSSKKLLIETAPKDVDVATSLAKQSALYNAEASLDDVILAEMKAAEKASLAEKSKTFSQRHPRITGVVKGVGRAGLLSAELGLGLKISHFIPLE